MKTIQIFLALVAVAIEVVDAKPGISFGGFYPPPGRTNLTDNDVRIVGGSIAMPGAHPHQISFQLINKNERKAYHICGGTILSPNTIACAAHCCEDQGQPKNPSTLRIVAGAHDLRFVEPTQQISDVEELIIHPKYKSYKRGYDACVLILRTPLILNSRVAKIDLCPLQDLPPNSKCVSSGWGLPYSGGQVSPVLKELKMSIVSRQKCGKMYSRFNQITESMLCASGLEEDESTCSGDSGGPLVCTLGGALHACLGGATSWGISPCGSKGYPSVYANVPYLRQFYGQNFNVPDSSSTSKQPPSVNQINGQAINQITMFHVVFSLIIVSLVPLL